MTITLRILGPWPFAAGDAFPCHHVTPVDTVADHGTATVAAANGRTRIVLGIEPAGSMELVGLFFRCSAAHPDTDDRCVGVLGHGGLHDCGVSGPVADACFRGRTQ